MAYAPGGAVLAPTPASPPPFGNPPGGSLLRLATEVP